MQEPALAMSSKRQNSILARPHHSSDATPAWFVRHGDEHALLPPAEFVSPYTPRFSDYEHGVHDKPLK
jgi:hypothetical protein